MRVMITGGAGFIGLHLARSLSARPGIELILIDNLQRGAMDAEFRALIARDGVTFLALDLTDPHAWSSARDKGTIPTDVDEIYHLAAVNGTRHFYQMPHEVLRTNVLSTIYLLEWVTRLERRPRVLFASSNEAYAGALAAFGQLPIPTPEDVPLVIADPRNPRWSYAGSKLIGEQFVIHYARHHQIPSMIVRPHNFYGPRAGRDHVIPELIARIERREDPFSIFGQDETRSFCYVEDAVDAMIRLMDRATYEAPTVHVGSGTETRIGDLADMLFELAGWRPSVVDPRPSPIGSTARRLPDVRLAREMTGWEASTALEDGLCLTYEWYLDHLSGATS
jgi:UDP-glucose 4-epimerase/UDP-glucuronate decarboxylase